MDENKVNDLELSGAQRIQKELEFLLNLSIPEMEPVPEKKVPEDEYDEEEEYEDGEYEDDEYEDDEYEDDECDEDDEAECVSEELKFGKPENIEKKEEDPVMELVKAARLLGLYGLDAETDGDNKVAASAAPETVAAAEEAVPEEKPAERPWVPTVEEIEAELRRIDSRSSLLFKTGLITGIAFVSAIAGTVISWYMGGYGMVLSAIANLF